MEFFDTFKKSVGYLFKLEGRAPRSEFWIFALLISLPWFAIYYALGYFGPQINNTNTLADIFAHLAGVMLFFGITTRRLNDRNLNGKIFASIYFAFGFLFSLFYWPDEMAIFETDEGFLIFSIANFLIYGFFLYQFVRRGTKGPNKYGDDPTPPKKEHPPSELRAGKPPFDRDGM